MGILPVMTAWKAILHSGPDLSASGLSRYLFSMWISVPPLLKWTSSISWDMRNTPRPPEEKIF